MTLEERKQKLLELLEQKAPEGQAVSGLTMMVITCTETHEKFDYLIEKLPQWVKNALAADVETDELFDG